jgi:hypothetical protein
MKIRGVMACKGDTPGYVSKMQQGLFEIWLGQEIGYVVKDAKRWEVEPDRTASEFDAGYYRKLLDKAWEEVAYVFK